MKRKMAKDLFPVHKRGGGCIKFPRAAAAALFTALSFVVPASLLSCDEDSEGEVNLDSRLYGTWTGQYNDTYIIENGILTYDDGGGYGGNFSGRIQYAETFSDAAGVIIIKYLAGEEKGDWADWSKTPSVQLERTGDFYGIYYIELTGDGSAGSTVKLQNTSNQDGTYGPTETGTLAEAIVRFTWDNKGLYTSSEGSAQTKQ